MSLGTAANEPALVLDYAPAPPAWWRRVLRKLLWFFLRRRVRTVEIVVGGWLLMVGLYFFAGSREYVPKEYHRTLLSAAYLAVTGATLSAFCILLMQFRWRAALLAVIIALPTGAVGGLFQTDRCPHATYLNIGGVTFAISGKACHNPRYFAPWWKR